MAPAAGATNVARSTNVSATFSERMDTASAQTAFSLARADTGAAVTGAFAWSGTTLTLDPTVDLAAGVEYVATVSTGAKDAAGNALATAKTWRFRTAPPLTTNHVPSATVITAGTLRAGTAARLGADDGSLYQVNSTTSGSARVAEWHGRIPNVPNGVTGLTITYRGNASASCTQVLSVYNWTKAAWTQLNSKSVGTTEVQTIVSPPGTLADYVSGTSGDGEVMVRIRCSRSTNFWVGGDLMRVAATR